MARPCLSTSDPPVFDSFEENTAVVGGAVEADSSACVFKNVSFISNGDSSTSAGGAMSISGLSPPAVQGSYFRNNRALYGGGVYISNLALPVFTDTVFDANVAIYEGGAMYLVCCLVS